MERKSLAQIEQEKKRLKQWLKSILKDNVDLFDLNSHYDSAISYQENKSELLEKVRLLIDPRVKIEQEVKEAKAIEELEIDKHNREIESEAEKYNAEYEEKLKNSSVNLDEYYEEVTTGIKKLAGGHINALFIKGVAGTGKSYAIRKALVLNKVNYVLINGDITEAYLYRVLYENNGKIIWLQDTSKVMTNMSAINKLKAALETEKKRVLTKSSYSKQQADLPESFVFDGKLIFDFNSTFGLPRGMRDDFEALLSRGEIIDVTFCFEEICDILRKVCKEDWQREVTEYVIKNYQFKGENGLNLRTQWHAFGTYKYAIENNLDWRDELNKSLIKKDSHIRRLVYRFIGKRSVRTGELAKLLIRGKVFNSASTASRRIKEWVYTGEIFRLSSEKINYYICLEPLTRIKGELNEQRNRQTIYAHNE